MLRLFGAKIGRSVHIYPSVRIAIPWNLTVKDEVGIGNGVILYSLGPIDIGSRATVSQFAHLCAGTHDYTRADMLLIKSPISVGDGAWICADAYVGPGITVGEFAVVGARAVVVKPVAQLGPQAQCFLP
jgi:putative colanic acid biosynthesis acetyltransferase WcaF